VLPLRVCPSEVQHQIEFAAKPGGLYCVHFLPPFNPMCRDVATHLAFPSNLGPAPSAVRYAAVAQAIHSGLAGWPPPLSRLSCLAHPPPYTC